MAALIAVLAPISPAHATAPIVKYYVVAETYSGKPETLAEISERFLGTTDRVRDIMALNKDRPQPDGGTLTDPNELHAGWLIILPWDAIGPGVIKGVLPTGKAQPGSHCAGVQPVSSSAGSNWAQLRLAPEQAWIHARGDGVLVAIVDSGVDASVPALSARVSNGADVVTGSGRGDVDCLGTGTSMAGLIVAQPAGGVGIAGVAPDAVIMPVRVVTNSPDAPLANEAAAIDVAVSAGATVVAIGSYVDVLQVDVLAAVARAAQHDVLVVVGPTTASVTPPMAGVVRAGAIGIDGQLAERYAAGGVDVVAPGVDITVLGIKGTGNLSGTGTQYAVAFVAGQAALIRSVDPAASAAEVAERIRQTATALVGEERPDPHYGWGLINLAASVQPVPSVAPSTSAAPPPPSSGVSAAVAWVSVAIAVVILLLLVSRIRRAIRSGDPGAHDDNPDGPVPPGPGGSHRREQGSPLAYDSRPLTYPATGAGPSARTDEPDRRGAYSAATGAFGIPSGSADPELGTKSSYGAGHGRRP